MTVHVLYDNQCVQSSLECGWGFSCLIDGRLLFDTGEAGPALMKNLKGLEIAPEEIEAVVISHPHWDHTGGLKALRAVLPSVPVYLPEGAAESFPAPDDLKGADWTSCPEATEVGPGITTGTFRTEYKGDFLPEQGVVLRTARGTSLVTGCAHPGILRMARATADVYGGENLYTLFGGFHLVDMEEEEILSTFAALKEIGFKRIIATHCSGETARSLCDYKTGAGDIISV
jgi:7,8-dihydropterin-6-yl-methyl-4-(beta-D-ribofuranosyl)aminobenzene 5'-phosphate synthase